MFVAAIRSFLKGNEEKMSTVLKPKGSRKSKHRESYDSNVKSLEYEIDLSDCR